MPVPPTVGSTSPDLIASPLTLPLESIVRELTTASSVIQLLHVPLAATVERVEILLIVSPSIEISVPG
jgi:hypothetical protein